MCAAYKNDLPVWAGDMLKIVYLFSVFEINKKRTNKLVLFPPFVQSGIYLFKASLIFLRRLPISVLPLARGLTKFITLDMSFCQSA